MGKYECCSSQTHQSFGSVVELFCECFITIWFTDCEQMAVATITLHSTASANIILQMFKFEYRNDNVVIMINIAHQ